MLLVTIHAQLVPLGLQTDAQPVLPEDCSLLTTVLNNVQEDSIQPMVTVTLAHQAAVLVQVPPLVIPVQLDSS